MRWIGWRAALAVIIALALAAPTGVGPASSAYASSTFTVNSTLDEPDATPGNGVCASTPSGACTLRAAIMEANALAGPDTVTVPAGVYTLTTLRPISITSEVTIVGASARSTTIYHTGQRGGPSADRGEPYWHRQHPRHHRRRRTTVRRE